MKVVFLGTGTSHGIPMIGCHCAVCTSTDPRDKRYRASLYLEKDGHNLVIDTGYEFRLQCLRAHIDHLDGVLYTHDHADHTAGLDDLRVFTANQALRVYGSEPTLASLHRRSPYAFTFGLPHHGIPALCPTPLLPYETYDIASFSVTPIPIQHGFLEDGESERVIYGYRIGTFAYLTDCSGISERSYEALRGVKTLVIGALRTRPHATHFCFDQALASARRIGSEKTYFTHMSHDTSYAEINRRFAPEAESAYDTMELAIEE